MFTRARPPWLQEGGIGSAILLHTPRPLELGDFKSILSAKALYEDLSENTTPEVFGMISDTFADGRIGLLVPPLRIRSARTVPSASSPTAISPRLATA